MLLSLSAPSPAKRATILLKQCVLFPRRSPNLSSSAIRRRHSTSSDALVQDSLKRYIRWYPHDAVTGANIDSYFSLRRNTSRPNSVLVGIIYENGSTRKSSRVVQALLADPLAAHSESWYRTLETRPQTENNLLLCPGQESSQVLPDAFTRSVHQIEVPSPVLNAETRPRYAQALPEQKSAANYVQFLEVNRGTDVANVADVCSFYIYVASSISTLDTLPHHVHQKILFTIVDNEQYTPRSVETTPVALESAHHVIKINSHVIAAGIDAFYRLDTAAASQYFESVQASNILEVAKLLSWHVRTENLRDWTFSLIKTEIEGNNLSENQIRTIYEDLKLGSLVKGSQQMHAELQKVFIPETEAFFRKKLPWYMLYFKNDNVEYAVKDYFSSHFMGKSIDGYNYLKGQLVARLQEQKFANYTEKSKFELRSPLQEYKANLINNRVPLEIQSVVYSSLISAFLYYQLPLSVLSLVGYLWVGIDMQTAVALAGLGWMLGFNHVSRTWHDFTDSWLKSLFEDVRLVIAKECMDEGLLKELNYRFESAKDLARIKQSVLADLEAASKEES